jgi:hypothetical protein
MSVASRISVLLIPILALLGGVHAAQAQATRTWVSGVGDDANPCSRTAPCKTFAGAISKTAAGGEISVLDPGGFGAVTITKSISIVAEGSEGSILGASTNGIIINARGTDRVNLHGLLLEGAGTGLNGIRILGGGEIQIENCVIRNFRGNPGIGIDMQASPGADPGTPRVMITNSDIDHNLIGINLRAPTGVVNGVFLDRSVVQANTTANLKIDGSGSVFVINGSTIVGGAIQVLNSGELRSYGNNALSGGGPTSTVPLQ